MGNSMPAKTSVRSPLAAHGAAKLPSVDVDSYNVELKDDEGFIGDRASKGAFRALIDLDEIFARGDTEAAGLIHGAIADFSQEFALVIRRFLKLKEWKDTERLVIGGG